MADYYADSSVLVKRHVQERGTAWVRSLAAPNNGNLILTARISIAEVYSAFNRRVREATLRPVDYLQIAGDFDQTWMGEYQLVELTSDTVRRAKQLLEDYPLRAYDAVQLATALLTWDTFQAAKLAPPTFLAADERLLDAAQAEGLAIDNPNLHP